MASEAGIGTSNRAISCIYLRIGIIPIANTFIYVMYFNRKGGGWSNSTVGDLNFVQNTLFLRARNRFEDRGKHCREISERKGKDRRLRHEARPEARIPGHSCSRAINPERCRTVPFKIIDFIYHCTDECPESDPWEIFAVGDFYVILYISNWKERYTTLKIKGSEQRQFPVRQTSSTNKFFCVISLLLLSIVDLSYCITITSPMPSRRNVHRKKKYVGYHIIKSTFVHTT